MSKNLFPSKNSKIVTKVVLNWSQYTDMKPEKEVKTEKNNVENRFQQPVEHDVNGGKAG